MIFGPCRFSGPKGRSPAQRVEKPKNIARVVVSRKTAVVLKFMSASFRAGLPPFDEPVLERFTLKDIFLRSISSTACFCIWRRRKIPAFSPRLAACVLPVLFGLPEISARAVPAAAETVGSFDILPTFAKEWSANHRREENVGCPNASPAPFQRNDAPFLRCASKSFARNALPGTRTFHDIHRYKHLVYEPLQTLKWKIVEPSANRNTLSNNAEKRGAQ